ncbi:transmembrane protein 249 isoform X4 [Choloepus didactylus]|uniref:transmembrane protein 249 isoform X4 n=1 Tax=Choloepus didactylus TaxID=27675 RepID=UPI00189E35DC|nr:transmembrane protein 249 isoform X4 [Choloepus didactylus]
MSGLPTTSGCKRFHLWALGCFCTERHLAKRLKNNSFYPFTQQLPNVFVLEYYLDTLWKGMVLFVVCLLLVSLGPLSKVCAPGPDPHGLPPPRGPAPAPSAAVRTVSPWPRRAAPCVRAPCTWSTCAWRSARTLVLCGHQLEPLVLVQLSERYEQMEFLGRHIARKLNINYFDCQAMSYWHVVRHWPLGSAFSPGIVQRRDHAYSKPSRSLTELDV